MYSTKLNHRTNRYIVKCIVNNKGPKFVDFVVDTGAKYTCCSFLSVDTSMQEADFAKEESKSLGGIVSGEVIKVYKYHISQFTVGTVDMGRRDIWITFDSRVSDDVLGMDILSDIYFYQDANNHTLFFYKHELLFDLQRSEDRANREGWIQEDAFDSEIGF